MDEVDGIQTEVTTLVLTLDMSLHTHRENTKRRRINNISNFVIYLVIYYSPNLNTYMKNKEDISPTFVAEILKRSR